MTDNLPYAKVCAAAVYGAAAVAAAARAASSSSSAAATAGTKLFGASAGDKEGALQEERGSSGAVEETAVLFKDTGGMPLGHSGSHGVNVGIPVGFEVRPSRSSSSSGGSFFDRLWAHRGKSNRFFIQGRRRKNGPS